MIITLLLCGTLLIAGCIGLPYYVGNKIKATIIALGAPTNVVVKPSYWKQNVKIQNLEIIPPSPSFIKKIIIPEIYLSYNGGFLLHKRVQIIKISQIEILVPNKQINLQQELPFNKDNIHKYLHLLPKEELKINAIIIKDTLPPDDNITLKFVLKPNVIIKHHYTLHLTLNSPNMKIRYKDINIEGNKVTAKMDGTLQLENTLLFDGKLQLSADDGFISPHALHFKKGLTTINVHTDNNQYLLKGKYELHHMSHYTPAVPAVGSFIIPEK